MDHLIAVLKALSDETRLRLLHLLLTRDLCGKALARSLGVSEAAVSQHLKTLRAAGLVVGEKRGYWIHYNVDRGVLEKAVHELEGLSKLSTAGVSDCRIVKIRERGPAGKEVKAMCQCCCQKPEKLKGKPEECTPQQIKDCHGDVKNHPCAGERGKEEGK
ncbi:MAG: metalloregulator ArsR/SmtB family transcription factor [Thermodesulfobacteriota bacterium]